MRRLAPLVLVLAAAPAAGDEAALLERVRAKVPPGVKLYLCAGDLDAGRWVEADADLTVEAASLIKVPLQYVVERRAAAGALDRRARLPLRPRAGEDGEPRL